MSDIRFEGWLHRTGTGGVYQDSAGNVGIASTQPKTRLDIQNGAFQIGPAGICTATTVNTTNIINATPLSHRNLIINGAMKIAQRATSSTTSNEYTIDRFHHEFSGTDESPTYAQVDVASGTSPYSSGFRKALRVTNGNQTSGAQASDYVQIDYRFEAQDIANSGWDYTSSSSNITVSFWVKSSVSKDFQIDLRTFDGTAQSFQFETPTLSADTWTKITQTIPGNSNLQFDNDNNIGLILFIFPYIGTTYTSASNTLNAWQTASASTYGVVDGTSWYTTNDATFEITGVQVELGSVATPFEHRSLADELKRCQRYYFVLADGAAASDEYIGNGRGWSSTQVEYTVRWVNEMRTGPSLLHATGTNYYQWRSDGGEIYTTGMSITNATVRSAILYKTGVSGAVARAAYRFQLGSAAAYIHFNAEL